MDSFFVAKDLSNFKFLQFIAPKSGQGPLITLVRRES